MPIDSETVFPEAEVKAALAECWQMATKEAKPPAPTADKPGSIMDPKAEMDSHGVARCFVAIDEKTGINIPETEAKDSCYDSLDDLVANLVPLAKKYFEKLKGKINRKAEDADSGA